MGLLWRQINPGYHHSMANGSDRSLLGAAYQRLYADYYNQSVMEKRRVTAIDTLAHIRQVIGADRFESVVDVGAGEGSLLAALDDGAIGQRLHALEISASGLEAIRRRQLSRLVQCDAFDGYQIDVPDRHYDLALCVHVLEHVEHERLMLRELRRIAKRLVIEVPVEHTLRVGQSIAVGSPYGHINFYSPVVFENLLKTCGWRVLRSSVVTQSLRYERMCSGWTGWIKYAIRRGLLGATPRLAPFLLTYSYIAYCES